MTFPNLPQFACSYWLMTGLTLLVLLGYVPYAVLGRFTAEKGQEYLQGWTQWGTIHQLLCLIGGFLWLAATVCYGRRSGAACPYCGRRDGPEGGKARTKPRATVSWSWFTYTGYFRDPRPTRTTVVVAKLVGPGHVEITVTARK